MSNLKDTKKKKKQYFTNKRSKNVLVNQVWKKGLLLGSIDKKKKKNKSLKDILDELGEVAEGVKTASAIDKLSKKYKIYTPIAQEVKLILDGKNPKDSLKDLLKN